jgi:hypothetical protein
VPIRPDFYQDLEQERQEKGEFIMAFEMFCMGMIAMLFGLVLAFAGYRLLWILLPIWGFFFGFGLGAQTVQVLFGVGLLSSVTSWLVGFFIGALFAALSYMFYFVAVALLSGAFGYALGVGLLTAIGLNFGFLVWLIGIIAGVAVAIGVLYFNIQKYAVIVMTAMAGTGVIVFTFLAAFGNLSLVDLLLGPVRLALQNSFWWLLFFIVFSGVAILGQILASQEYEAEVYNRMAIA